MRERIREWFDRARPRVFRRRSLGGWIVTIFVALWAVADRASTAQSIARWWSDAQPYLSRGWTAVASIDRFWYQMALLFIGLGWIAYVASRPEPTETKALGARDRQTWSSLGEDVTFQKLQQQLDQPTIGEPTDPKEQGNALLRTGNELLRAYPKTHGNVVNLA